MLPGEGLGLGVGLAQDGAGGIGIEAMFGADAGQHPGREVRGQGIGVVADVQQGIRRDAQGPGGLEHAAAMRAVAGSRLACRVGMC